VFKLKSIKKNVKARALGLVSKIAIQEVRRSANTSCVVLAYQPQLPEAAKKFRKF
jgi:hypothetical protein